MTYFLLALLAALDAGAAPKPAPAPATPSAATPPSAPARAAAVTQPTVLRDAKQILADYARAIGDEKSWAKHKTVRVKRDVQVKAMHFVSHEETRIARGGKMLATSEMPGMGSFRRGSDGRTAWAEDPISGLRVLTGAEAEDVRIAAAWNSEWHLDTLYAKVLAVPPPSDVPGSEAWECVELTKRKGQPSTLCFDSKTHLRVWERGVQASQGGDVPYVTRFSDWRDVDGVRIWHHEDATAGPITMDAQVVEIVFDEPMPARLFALPRKK
jgi:hypothetical protein